MYFSLIIPVYNRPDEIWELLQSLSESTFTGKFEVVVIEDGSTISASEVISEFEAKLDISYFSKPNSGPGDSRNFGMKHAKGDYFLIFDSDCVIPKHYLSLVENNLRNSYADCFGGPDNALESFSDIQKAINFAMTSILTTGGIRGGSEALSKFQPRSFNMGLSKKAFEMSGGFGNIHPGEDPDLAIRLWKLGFETKLFPKAYVFHKRRIDWRKFSVQVSKFGKARPILDSWYPEYAKLTFYFPSLFLLGAVLSIAMLFWSIKIFAFFYVAYFFLIFLTSSFQNKSIRIGFYSVMAVARQFYFYGLGFMLSKFKIKLLGIKPEKAFPELFF